MRRVPFAITLVLLAAVPVAASATPASAMTLATALHVDALALRGDGVLIADAAAPAPQVRLLRGADAPRLIASGGAGTCTSDEAELAVSDAALAVDLACDGGDLALTALTGQALAPLPRTARPGGVAVSGTRVASVVRSGDIATVVVRDLTGATPDVRIVPDVANASTIRLRLAGDVLGVVAGIPAATVSLRVYDLATGTSTTRYDSDIADFDVAADGTVACCAATARSPVVRGCSSPSPARRCRSASPTASAPRASGSGAAAWPMPGATGWSSSTSPPAPRRRAGASPAPSGRAAARRSPSTARAWPTPCRPAERART